MFYVQKVLVLRLGVLPILLLDQKVDILEGA